MTSPTTESSEDNPWPGRFEQERARLLAALGPLTAGGIVDSIEHIGPSSVPGLPPGRSLAISLSVSPFPLEAGPRAALEGLGYESVALPEGAEEQRFRHTSEPFHLSITEPGSDHGLDHVLVRDYWRHHPEAATPPDISAEPDQVAAATIAAAHQWWVGYHGFTPLKPVAQEMRAFAQPWYFASGWALDLFLGTVSRVHHDVDIVIARSAQMLLQSYMTERGWTLLTPLEHRLEPWPAHMRLELPRHQVHAHRAGAFVDFLLTDIAHGLWRYRRVPSVIRLEAQMGMTSSDGLPYLAPELALLFKSKSVRWKDQADFDRVVSRLDPERRAWLRWALVATAPDHVWLDQL